MTNKNLEKLTVEQKRTAIALACGYVRKPLDGVGTLYWRRPDGEAISTLDLPKFSTVLNAIHSAE